MPRLDKEELIERDPTKFVPAIILEPSSMGNFDSLRVDLTRRTFLGRATTGIGSVALASLLNPGLLSAADSAVADDRWRGVVNPLHFRPRAKRVIFLYMAGGPSHLETLDYKPKLAK